MRDHGSTRLTDTDGAARVCSSPAIRRAPMPKTGHRLDFHSPALGA
ncbi:MAG: hypothetical protein MZU91_15135 [Desulfosudis oleivorans]|nr:hypothetical protein [Desulfosudis oleivorans]